MGLAMAVRRREELSLATAKWGGAENSNGMAKKSDDVICEGEAVHRNDSLRQGFASDALAWKREEMP